MAVPKRKTSKSKKGMRRSHDRVAVPNVITCSCGEATLSHRVCTVCGAYKGRTVITRAEAPAAA